MPLEHKHLFLLPVQDAAPDRSCSSHFWDELGRLFAVIASWLTDQPFLSSQAEDAPPLPPKLRLGCS